MPSSPWTKLRLHMTPHILHHLSHHQTRFALSPFTPPLFVAVQGPQGAGKTFLTSLLENILSGPPHNLHVAVLSIDDFYLPHAGLRAIASKHSQNAMLHGRGPPGTHDIPLGGSILHALKHINDSDPASPSAFSDRTVRIPVFDKSLINGEGDRLPSMDWRETKIPPKLDVVILEGWCLGFTPISQRELEERWVRLGTATPDIQNVSGGRNLDWKKTIRKADIEELSHLLEPYVEWWKLFDVFIQLSPPPTHPYEYIYEWRLEQEHEMKAKNGGRGMSDEQVKTIVLINNGYFY